MKILIVDDDRTSRMMLKAVLQKWEFEVIEAENGLEAWQLLSKADFPRLLIMDWMMPGLTGPELCRKISAEHDRELFYILMLTAKGERQDLIEGLNAGADDFVAKPWNNEELRARINVGHRMLSLQELAAKRQKLQGVLEMAGAVCHELNQPLQVAMGYADMLLLDLDQNDPKKEQLQRIVESVEKMGELTRKIMNITDSGSISYIEGYSNLIDIHKSSK